MRVWWTPNETIFYESHTKDKIPQHLCVLRIYCLILSNHWPKKQKPLITFEATPGIGSTAVHRTQGFVLPKADFIFQFILKAQHGLRRGNQQRTQRPVSASQCCKNVSTPLNTNTLKTVTTSCDSSNQPISTSLDKVKANGSHTD